MQTLVQLFGREAASWMRTALLGVASASQAPASPRDWYDLLEAYYSQNGLYQILRDAGASAGLSGESIRSIRNPAFRAVEFHASHLWAGPLPDALPIVTENTQLEAAVDQVWTWSNWGARKQVVARTFALYGDWFVKVRSTGDFVPPSERRVWFQMIEPRTVTEFRKDDRGYVTFIRLDSPQITTDSAGVVTERWSHVEVWDKARGTYRQWRHVGDSVAVPTEQLTGLEVEETLLAVTGVDFIPIVHAPFRDVGDARGVGCFVPVIDKIDEVNRIATRLHQMGFRNLRNLWASTRTGTDAANRPLPSVNVGGMLSTAVNALRGNTQYDPQTGRPLVPPEPTEMVIDLPGSTDLKSLVPPLPYEHLLAIVQDHMSEIGNDLPEIRWYELSQQGADLSSRAIRLLMAPAASRVEEARGNAETALVRADQIAVTMGQAIGLFGGVGTYENGDLDHSFEPRDVFPLSGLDEAEEQRTRGQAAQAYQSAGVPLMTIATDVMGMTEADARRMLATATQEANSAADRAMAAFGAGDNQGQGNQGQGFGQ